MTLRDDRTIAIGHDLGPYRIDALLGAGGMGIVYRAHHRELARPVAIKMVDRRRSNSDSARWLLQEARLAAALDHPGICGVHDIGYLDDEPFIVMEHVEGTPLAALIPTGRGFAAEIALNYAMQIADAVAHAHGRGIVHRDLKSSNIIVTREGRAKLLDFGLAIRAPECDASELETTSSRDIPSGAGTVPYMAPELLRGRPADRRSDVWALGVLIYEVFSGRRPFVGGTRYELAAAILSEAPAPLGSAAASDLRRLVARALAKDPVERYACAREVAAALDDLV